MSKALSPHPVSHKDITYCLTDDDFTDDGMHKVLTPRLADELSSEFESAVRRRFKRKKWKISTNGSSPWRGNIKLIEIQPVPDLRFPHREDETFVLDFNIVPVSNVGKKKNNSPIVQCRVLRYVKKKYMGVIHESLRSGAGTYNPDQWAYLAYIVIRTWVEHEEAPARKTDDTRE